LLPFDIDALPLLPSTPRQQQALRMEAKARYTLAKMPHPTAQLYQSM
jgi:hypothetical protein